MPPAEVLVELQPGAAVEDAVPAGMQILQQLPPRLAIVAADDDDVRALEDAPGVSAVFPAEVPPDAMERLDQLGRAFAAAWNARRQSKERIGEGLSWDAPGFEPPDR
jgi:hypothetical protein